MTPGAKWLPSRRLSVAPPFDEFHLTPRYPAAGGRGECPNEGLVRPVRVLLGAGLLAEAAPALKGDGTGNLVANGSFEDGPAVPAEGYKPLDKGATDLKGWVVTRGQIDAVRETGGLWKAADGKRCLDLHGSPGLGGVKQTVATRAGRKYRSRFRCPGTPAAAIRRSRSPSGRPARTRSSPWTWPGGRWTT